MDAQTLKGVDLSERIENEKPLATLAHDHLQNKRSQSPTDNQDE